MGFTLSVCAGVCVCVRVCDPSSSRCLVPSPCSGRNDEFQMRVEASCIVMGTLLKSWPGLMCLSGCPNGSFQSALASVVEVLPLVGIKTQVCVCACVCMCVCAYVCVRACVCCIRE